MAIDSNASGELSGTSIAVNPDSSNSETTDSVSDGVIPRKIAIRR